MSARLHIPHDLTLFNNPSERGAWLMTSETMLSHLARWPLFHRRVWESVIQCCNGALESRRRKRAAHFRAKMASIYGRDYSLENIQRAVSDLIAWGFLVPVSGSLNAHSGRVYLLAGLDFATPQGAAYLAARPHFRRRIKARSGAPVRQPTMRGAPIVGGENIDFDLSDLEGSYSSPTADPPLSAGEPLPIPGDREITPALPIPGDRDKARPISLARPIPPTPAASKRQTHRKTRRPKVGGGNFDQLIRAYKQLHHDRRSQLTPATIRRALDNARAAHPELTHHQIAEKLIAVARSIPAETRHPILWAAKTDWAEVLAPRPMGRQFADPAPAAIAITPEQCARQIADLELLGLVTPKSSPAPVTPSAPSLAPEDAGRSAERTRVMLTLDRQDRAAWLDAQLAAH